MKIVCGSMGVLGDFYCEYRAVMLPKTQDGVEVCPVLLLTLFHPTYVANGVEDGEK